VFPAWVRLAGKTHSLDKNITIEVPEDRFGLYSCDILDPDVVCVYTAPFIIISQPVFSCDLPLMVVFNVTRDSALMFIFLDSGRFCVWIPSTISMI
jgi:hypothetical protein